MTTLLDLRSSLRARLLLGMGLMLLPIVALAGVAFVSSRAIVDAIEEVVVEQTQELDPVSRLLRLVLHAAMGPHDYLATGDETERAEFERIAVDTDALFARLERSGVFGSDEERALLREALGGWEQARVIGRELLAGLPPVGSEDAARRMKAFDAHLDRAADALGRLYDRVLLEAHGYRERSLAVQSRETTLLVVVSLLSLVLAGVAAVVLSRSIVVPVRTLQDGIVRFAEGDHSFRVALDGTDEFGQLAETMNRLAERLETDQLTGATSRSALLRRLREEVGRARRFERPLAVLMVDVDHFKAVNDHHGHPAGDRALRVVAGRLSQGLRGVDTAARYGGEEFALVLPETAGPGARAVAERLRASVAGEPVPVGDGVTLPITVSVGVAVFPADATDDAGLLAAADRALYAAKQWGRNRVVEAAAVDATRGGPAEAADPIEPRRDPAGGGPA